LFRGEKGGGEEGGGGGRVSNAQALNLAGTAADLTCCVQFEKFITEDQALFGAMDGHGPNGAATSSPLDLRGRDALHSPCPCQPTPPLPRPLWPAGHLVSGYVKKHLPMLLVNLLTAGHPLQVREGGGAPGA
jgi:hypothetical protein